VLEYGIYLSFPEFGEHFYDHCFEFFI